MRTRSARWISGQSMLGMQVARPCLTRADGPSRRRRAWPPSNRAGPHAIAWVARSATRDAIPERTSDCGGPDRRGQMPRLGLLLRARFGLGHSSSTIIAPIDGPSASSVCRAISPLLAASQTNSGWKPTLLTASESPSTRCKLTNCRTVCRMLLNAARSSSTGRSKWGTRTHLRTEYSSDRSPPRLFRRCV